MRKNRLRILSALIDRLATTLTGAEIRSTAIIGPGLHVAHTYGLVIGGNVRAGSNLSVRQCTTIGGSGGKVRQNGDGVRWSQPMIGDNVSIGCNSALLGLIKVGSDATIGASSLVIHDVSPQIVVGGVPAKPIGGTGFDATNIL